MTEKAVAFTVELGQAKSLCVYNKFRLGFGQTEVESRIFHCVYTRFHLKPAVWTLNGRCASHSVDLCILIMEGLGSLMLRRMAMSRIQLQFASKNKMPVLKCRELFIQHHLSVLQRSHCSLARRCKKTWSLCSSGLQNYKYASNKSFSVHSFARQAHVNTAQNGVHSLTLSAYGRDLQIPLIWLRDHCRCEVCYNSATTQKNADNYSLNGVLKAANVLVDGDTLSVKWQDDHVSSYSLKWLVSSFHCSSMDVERFLWDGPCMAAQTLPAVEFESHMKSKRGLRQTLVNLLKYGFCAVQGAPGTVAGTQAVAERISFVLETVFGRFSLMTSGMMSHSDTAYTNQALNAHTDTTYYTQPAGIQVFHCLQHDGEGGNTLLVDGFNAAERLRKNHPTYFEKLVHTVVPHEYIEGTTSHLYSLGTVLSVDPVSGQLINIRFNPYDRASLCTLPAQGIPEFYVSYDALTQIIHSRESEFWLKLLPGTVLLVDNWRVMHGRSSFTGKRVVSGCYLPRDDWLSQARVMGLL